MKAEVVNNPTIKLELTHEEALWLKGVMQNPMSDDQDPSKESPIDARLRETFWQVLNQAGVKQ